MNLGIEALKLSQMAAHDADSSGSNPWRLDVDRIDLGTALQLSTGGATAQVTAHNLQAQVHAAALTVDDRKPPALALASATLSGGTLDLAAHRAAQILATHRAERIAQFLTEKGIERSRVQTGQVESTPVTDAGTVAARLQMSAAQP